MSGWPRTTKPSADTTISAGDIYGVDRNEIAVTEGIAQTGWVKRTTVGSRVKHEVLVAMKTPPTEDNADDSVLPDTVLAIATQPADDESASGSAVTFTVVATATPKMKGPTKFATADRVTAWRGLRTRVPITVATELAESLNPLTKSKIKATIMAPIANSNI